MTYTQYKLWIQEKINALPIHYAFGEKQFNEMLEKHFNGMSAADAPKLLYATNSGGYYLRTDAEKIRDTFAEIDETEKRLIAEDTTGDGFIYQMFIYELANHEYIITRDVTETLDAVGITPDETETNPAIKHGLQKAIDKIIKIDEKPAEMNQNGIIYTRNDNGTIINQADGRDQIVYTVGNETEK